MTQSQFFKTLLSLRATKELSGSIPSRSIARENPLWPPFTSSQVISDIAGIHAVAVEVFVSIVSNKGRRIETYFCDC